jgi:hypothetical protein
MFPDSGSETIHHKPNGDTAMILYRLDQIEKKIDQNNSDHEIRLRDLEDMTARLSERMTIWQLGQAAFTAVAAVLAAAYGKLP